MSKEETPVDNTQLILMASAAANAAEADPRLKEVATKLLKMVFEDDSCKLQMLMAFTQAQQAQPAGSRTPSQIRQQLESKKTPEREALKEQLLEAIKTL
jgi:hypothetical protein